jgi:hypothetical protein
MKPLGVRELAAKLHEVNQGAMTLQTMVFEPHLLRLNLSMGPCPASGYALRQLDLSQLLNGRCGS